MRQIKATLVKGALIVSALVGGVGAVSAQSANSDKTSTKTSQITAVLELFTSQGCSSCPAADALLATYAKRSDVLALSFSVDYWDYLGWKDTLASPKFSARQRTYAATRGDGRVYTPQVVIGGSTHAVGSSASAIDQAIAATKAKLANVRIPVHAHMDKRHIVVETGAAQPGAPVREATIWLAMIRREVAVKIGRGENTGRTVTYHNVVKELSPIGMWSGKAETVQLARDAMPLAENESCAVLVQVGKGGPIIGAARISTAGL